MDEPVELLELLQQFTYRPGWRFRVIRETGGYMLLISAEVIDTDNPHKVIPLQFCHGIPRFMPQNFDWTRWLRDMVMEVERHECHEFFKVSGVKVYDPHG